MQTGGIYLRALMRPQLPFSGYTSDCGVGGGNFGREFHNRPRRRIRRRSARRRTRTKRRRGATRRAFAYYYRVGRRSGTRCDPKINSVCGSVRRHRSARARTFGPVPAKVPADAAAAERYHASFTRTRGRDGPGFSAAVLRFSTFCVC